MVKQFDENARKVKANAVIITQALDVNILSIRGSSGNATYTVDLNKGTCTCGDYIYRCASIGANCKHLIACRQNVVIMGVIA